MCVSISSRTCSSNDHFGCGSKTGSTPGGSHFVRFRFVFVGAAADVAGVLAPETGGGAMSSDAPFVAVGSAWRACPSRSNRAVSSRSRMSCSSSSVGPFVIQSSSARSFGISKPSMVVSRSARSLATSFCSTAF